MHESFKQSGETMDFVALERDAGVETGRLFNEFIKKDYAVTEALLLLDSLDQKYTYHSKAHTYDVIRETILFAVIDGAPENVIRQEAISAAWHDTGFVKGRPQGMTTEQYAVHLFEKSVAHEMLTKEDPAIVANVIANIEDTEVRKDGVREGGSRRDGESIPSLKKLHERTPGFVLDGDVSNFGRGDFFGKLESVAKELGYEMLDDLERKEFYAYVLNLMRNHEWQTASARFLREPQKQENMRILQEMHDAI